MQTANSVAFEIDNDVQTDLYLIFTIGKESYGIDIAHVLEIVKLPAITQMPEMPEYIIGIINLRGKIIPLMDMRLRFGKNPKDYDDRTCIIVVQLESSSIGLIVDSVTEVQSISDDCICQTPDMKSLSGRGLVKNIGKVGGDVKLLIDCDMLLDSNELMELGEIC